MHIFPLSIMSGILKTRRTRFTTKRVYPIWLSATSLQALTVFVVDIGPHMHMDIELVAEALRTFFLSKVNVLHTPVMLCPFKPTLLS